MRRSSASLLCIAVLALSLPSAGLAATARVAKASGAWSDPATWGGPVPERGDKVEIPQGISVSLDTSTPSLGGVQVDGTLSFAPRDLDLTAAWIMVHGTLEVGTADQPFQHRAAITLTGSGKENVMDMGTRFLGVMGGNLELHGRKIKGWTRLARTAEGGSRSIELLRPMPWRPGDRIVIASSSYWSTHDEERTITNVSGSTVELNEPLRRRHWGELQTFDGRTVDERAEVGLLTRNVVIRGADDSDDEGFGGHVMIMEGGEARIEGVEFDRMGQRLLLRRYPVHFHMEGRAETSYLKRSSIHHSFNRCMTIHGTHGLQIKNNVCFDHAGHGIFFEDGVETDNKLIGNLVLGTRSVEDGLLPTDERAASFWITNPDNIIRNNVAAGSEGTGFWYALPEHPTGLSENDGVWPRRTPLAEFKGNVAHSNGNVGLNVDDGPDENGNTTSTYYRPLEDPSDEESDTVPVYFDNFTSYFNRDRGIWLRGENHFVRNAVLADNRAGATFASSESWLVDSLVVGETANPGTVEDWEDTGPNGRALPFFWEPETPIIGYEFYDGRVGTKDTTFVNFRHNSLRRSGALGYLAPNAFSISPQNSASGVRLVDANPVYLADPEAGMDGDQAKVFIDTDGSVTGTAGRAVVVNNPFLLTDDCKYQTQWNAHVCPTEYVSLMVGANNSNAIKPVKLKRSDGVEQRLMGCCDDSDDAWTSAFPDQTYRVAYNGGTPRNGRFVLYGGRGRWVQLTIPVDSAYKVTRWGRALRDVDGLDLLRSTDDSAYYFDQGSGLLHVKIFGHGDWEEVRIERS